MKAILYVIKAIAGIAFALFALISCKESSNTMKPPVADKNDTVLTAHGHQRTDPYYWMNNRENPAVLEYLKAENEYTQDMMRGVDSLRNDIFKEMVGRIAQTDMSAPYFLNGYFYYTRYEEGKEYPIYCRKKGKLDNVEQIMLDVNQLAIGHSFFNVAGLNVSPDNRLLAYGVDTVSRRNYTLHIKNLETGELYPERIPNTTGNVAWSADNQTIFYSVKDQTTLRPYLIYRYKLGSGNVSEDLVFSEEDETYAVSVYNSKSREFVFIASYGNMSSEFRFLNAGTPQGSFTVIQQRQPEIEYYPSHYKEHFYIRTNLNAPNFRLVKAPVTDPGEENWQEVIPHRQDVLLDDFEVFRSYLALNERFGGLPHIRIIQWADGKEFFPEFPDPAYMVYFSVNPEFNTDFLRYGYTSLTTPSSVYDLNMKTKETTLMKRQEVLGGYDPADYVSERLMIPAHDGVEVPLSLVYRKDTKLNGEAPLLLVGYGSYGSSYDPSFSSARLSLIDRGFIYAIAHVRGGEEMGRNWYEDGKKLKKINTFNDFIDCGRYLTKNGYTNPDKLFASGGSAGGLLIGAVINMEPELFRGVIAAVPFVDVVTTMLDESIPLTTGEYNEWGNPNEKEYYDYMLSYSPYDNVVEQNYPNILVTTGWHDSQVQYWEPAKWVAKLRDKKTDDNILLLWTNLDYGHGGASGRFERLKEVALEYSFLLMLLGIES
ncbi:MAG: S9 family peptidase [Bacteroidetes bacterium]|nr:S9 family peptidase [Bacteroidota bacterium]